MKQISLLITLLITLTTFGQGASDLRKRGWHVLDGVESIKKENDTINDLQTAFAFYKMRALEPVKLVFSKEEKVKLTELFKSQYEPYKLAYNKYEDGKASNAKVQLLSVLAKNEEDFRNALSREQLATYISFASNHGGGEGYYFDKVFLPNDRLEKYKKEIE